MPVGMFSKQSVVILGNLAMNRLKANCGEGKMKRFRGILQLALHDHATNQPELLLTPSHDHS